MTETLAPEVFFAALDATWPAAFAHRVGPWTIREGQGGGQRVSAATVAGAWVADDIELAEAAMAGLGQPALFMVRGGDTALDAELAARGYRINDPVVAYGVPLQSLTTPPPDPMAGFALWPPLGIACDLWAEAGIGPARLAVMQRAKGPKTAILGRVNDRAAGVAFVACHDGVAMLHALEVAPNQRRQGVAVKMMRKAAIWAQDHGADWLALAVTQSNAPARALYASLGMAVVGQYHYRVR